MVRDLQDIKIGINEKLKNEEAVELFENMDLELPKENDINEDDKLKIEFKERKNLITTLKHTTLNIENIFNENQKIVELKGNIICDDIQQIIYGFIKKNITSFINLFK